MFLIINLKETIHLAINLKETIHLANRLYRKKIIDTFEVSLGNTISCNYR